MKKLEKVAYVGCPWLFGIIMVAGGLYASLATAQKIIGAIMVGYGLICMSLCCVCALLAKIIEAKAV